MFARSGPARSEADLGIAAVSLSSGGTIEGRIVARSPDGRVTLETPQGCVTGRPVSPEGRGRRVFRALLGQGPS